MVPNFASCQLIMMSTWEMTTANNATIHHPCSFSSNAVLDASIMRQVISQKIPALFDMGRASSSISASSNALVNPIR